MLAVTGDPAGRPYFLFRADFPAFDGAGEIVTFGLESPAGAPPAGGVAVPNTLV